jgi:hypothetical protein
MIQNLVDRNCPRTWRAPRRSTSALIQGPPSVVCNAALALGIYSHDFQGSPGFPQPRPVGPLRRDHTSMHSFTVLKAPNPVALAHLSWQT